MPAKVLRSGLQLLPPTPNFGLSARPWMCYKPMGLCTKPAGREGELKELASFMPVSSSKATRRLDTL